MRTWFSEENTAGLEKSDLAIMNRVARMLEDHGIAVTNAALMTIRMDYRPGMSAQQLFDVVTEDK
jgi:hypothetical protein